MTIIRIEMESVTYFRTTCLALLFMIFSMVLVKGYAETPKNNLKNKRVLVYTKNGEGFVHDNIPYAVACMERMSADYDFDITVTDDPSFFTDKKLAEIDIMVFTSTNNDVFETNAQRLAFRKYIQSGGGIVGIHSAVGTERNWEWFKMLIGGRFVWHPKFQEFNINIIDKSHVSVSGLPDVWTREDECYLMQELYPGIKVVMAHDLESLNTDQRERVLELSSPFHRFYPAVWYQDFDGGYVWVTALGHHKDDYKDPVFVQHIYQGMNYIAGKISKKDGSKIYATAWDTPVKF